MAAMGMLPALLPRGRGHRTRCLNATQESALVAHKARPASTRNLPSLRRTSHPVLGCASIPQLFCITLPKCSIRIRNERTGVVTELDDIVGQHNRDALRCTCDTDGVVCVCYHKKERETQQKQQHLYDSISADNASYRSTLSWMSTSM